MKEILKILKSTLGEKESERTVKETEVHLGGSISIGRMRNLGYKLLNNLLSLSTHGMPCTGVSDFKFCLSLLGNL